MADNYLEKQMELYESRKAAWERQKKLGKKKAAPRPNASSDTKTSNPK